MREAMGMTRAAATAPPADAAPAPVPDSASVAAVVRSVLETMRGDLTAREAGLLADVEDLGRTIAAAKAEIATLRVNDITADHIPLATDELDAIVAHTAAATECILETCETLDRVAEDLASHNSAAAAAQLQEATTRIYEACSFQDITGQRIGKVVAVLKAIEAKVARIVSTFGVAHWHEPHPPVPDPPSDADLLNGAQLPAAAMAQTDIDQLLASFDL